MAASRISSRDNDQCTKKFIFDAKLIFIFYADIFILFKFLVIAFIYIFFLFIFPCFKIF